MGGRGLPVGEVYTVAERISCPHLRHEQWERMPHRNERQGGEARRGGAGIRPHLRWAADGDQKSREIQGQTDLQGAREIFQAVVQNRMKVRKRGRVVQSDNSVLLHQPLPYRVLCCCRRRLPDAGGMSGLEDECRKSSTVGGRVLVGVGGGCLSVAWSTAEASASPRTDGSGQTPTSWLGQPV